MWRSAVDFVFCVDGETLVLWSDLTGDGCLVKDLEGAEELKPLPLDPLRSSIAVATAYNYQS